MWLALFLGSLQEVYEKLNYKHKIWAECSVVLDEVDPAIGANLES